LSFAEKHVPTTLEGPDLPFGRQFSNTEELAAIPFQLSKFPVVRIEGTCLSPSGKAANDNSAAFPGV